MKRHTTSNKLTANILEKGKIASCVMASKSDGAVVGPVQRVQGSPPCAPAVQKIMRSDTHQLKLVLKAGDF